MVFTVMNGFDSLKYCEIHMYDKQVRLGNNKEDTIVCKTSRCRCESEGQERRAYSKAQDSAGVLEVDRERRQKY